MYATQRISKKILKEVISSFYQEALFGLDEERKLPHFIKNEFSSYLDCGEFKNGAVRLHCKACNHNQFLPFSCKKRGICPSCSSRKMHSTAANLVDYILPEVKVRQWVLSVPFRIRYLMAYDKKVLNGILGIFNRVVRSFYRKNLRGIKRETGAITFIQRFGGSLNLNVHFHTLFLEGVYISDGNKNYKWIESTPPKTSQIKNLNNKIIKRVNRFLLKHGFIEEFEERNFQLTDNMENDISEIYQSSISRGKLTGRNKGQKIDEIGKYLNPPWEPPKGKRLSYINGFSLHANVCVSNKNRNFLERLCRYAGREAVSESRLSLDNNGSIIYQLKKKYSDGTSHLKFTPREFISKLIALIPPPKSHIIRYHGVLAPNSKWRKHIIPKGPSQVEGDNFKRNYWIPWADLLKRVFYDHLTKCEKCGHSLKIVEYFISIEEMNKFLSLQMKERGPPNYTILRNSYA